MSKSFYEVEYEGNFQSVSDFIKDKVECSTNYLNSQKFLVEINSDDKDELIFFSNSQMDDSISKILKIQEISKDQYSSDLLSNSVKSVTNTTTTVVTNLPSTVPVEHFPPTNVIQETVQDSVKDKIDKIFNDNALSTSTIIEDTRNFIPTPENTITPKPVDGDVVPQNLNDKVAKYLSDTIVPSRTQVKESDPFSFITSKDYLLYFSFGASITLFVLNLFN